MVTPIVRRIEGAEQVSRAAAEEFIRLARSAIVARGRFTVALSGGSTPRCRQPAQATWRGRRA
jgi:6-phosphogluconolactonase